MSLYGNSLLKSSSKLCLPWQRPWSRQAPPGQNPMRRCSAVRTQRRLRYALIPLEHIRASSFDLDFVFSTRFRVLWVETHFKAQAETDDCGTEQHVYDSPTKDSVTPTITICSAASGECVNGKGSRRHVKKLRTTSEQIQPVSVLRLWISEGLTQAES